MRMRAFLLAASLMLPVTAQVWLPDGTQIRVQRPDRSPGFVRSLGITFGLPIIPFTHPTATPFALGPPMPAFGSWHGYARSLERLDPHGRITELPSPEALDLQMESLNTWDGAAYALGQRCHPASDRASSPSQRAHRSMELWVSRDFRTWQPLARYTPKYPGDWLLSLLPLEQDRFIGPLWSNPMGLVIFHREANGQLVQERILEFNSWLPLICRSPKGIVVFDNREIQRGQYQVLDNRDARELRRGQLELPERFRLLSILARPDGNLLILTGRGPWESPFLLSYDYHEKRESSQMALGILNAKAWREEPSWPSTAPFRWFILDPATGQQTATAPPAGFPKDIQKMRALQFRDPQNLEW